MFLIDCPYCGPREQTEFRNGGEAHIARPADPAALSDAEWADYVFMRDNPKGLLYERWVHIHGCRRWFNAARNTVTDRILAIYPIGAPRPPVPPGQEPPTPSGEIAETSANRPLEPAAGADAPQAGA